MEQRNSAVTTAPARLGIFLVALALAVGAGWAGGRALNPSGTVTVDVAPHPSHLEVR